jgi:hypothetical protein
MAGYMQIFTNIAMARVQLLRFTRLRTVTASAVTPKLSGLQMAHLKLTAIPFFSMPLLIPNSLPKIMEKNMTFIVETAMDLILEIAPGNYVQRNLSMENEIVFLFQIKMFFQSH